MPSAVTISLTEATLLTALSGFFSPIVNCPILTADAASAGLPSGASVVLTPTLVSSLSSLRSVYVDHGADNGARLDKRPSQWTVQVECYGSVAADNAALIAGVFSTEFACEQFQATGLDMAPLYAGDLSNTSLIDSEQHYQKRWTLNLVMQTNPVIQTPMDFAAQLNPLLVEVDTTFPPGDHP